MSQHEPYLDRKTYLGGSDISAIIGVDPYASALTIYNRKLGLEEREPPSFAMKRGIHLEPAILSLYRDVNDVYLGPAGVTPPHPFFPFLMGNYDKTQLDKKNGVPVLLLEAKTANLRQAAKWGDPDDGEKKVPVNYYVQANYYCGLLGLERFAIVALLMWRDELQVYDFDFDETTFTGCCEAGARFWVDNVLPRVPPDPEAHRSTHDEMVKLWPKTTGEVVTADEALQELWPVAFEAFKDKKRAEQVLSEVKDKIQFFAKEACAVEFADGCAKIVDKRGSPRWKDIAACLAEVAGITIASAQWNELVASHTGKPTRYVKLPWSGDQE